VRTCPVAAANVKDDLLKIGFLISQGTVLTIFSCSGHIHNHLYKVFS